MLLLLLLLMRSRHRHRLIIHHRIVQRSPSSSVAHSLQTPPLLLILQHSRHPNPPLPQPLPETLSFPTLPPTTSPPHHHHLLTHTAATQHNPKHTPGNPNPTHLNPPQHRQQQNLQPPLKKHLRPLPSPSRHTTTARPASTSTPPPTMNPTKQVRRLASPDFSVRPSILHPKNGTFEWPYVSVSPVELVGRRPLFLFFSSFFFEEA
jgi:hypothetical protein